MSGSAPSPGTHGTYSYLLRRTTRLSGAAKSDGAGQYARDNQCMDLGGSYSMPAATSGARSNIGYAGAPLAVWKSEDRATRKEEGAIMDD